MERELGEGFFYKSPEIVAKELIGKIIVRDLGKKKLKAKIIECEAYFGKEDPASWARFGKRKDNSSMWLSGGHILVKNVHKYFMLNFVTGNEGEPQAVLIRAVEPLNFSARCSGPGLLSLALKINKSLDGLNLFKTKEISLFDSGEKEFKIKENFRIGVKKDLKRKLRFSLEK